MYSHDGTTDLALICLYFKNHPENYLCRSIKTDWKRRSGLEGSYYTIGKPWWNDYAGEMMLDNAVPAYSEDIAAAWEVVEKLHFDFTITSNTPYPSDDEDCWLADFYGGEFEGKGSTPAHAICLAALMTVGHELPKSDESGPISDND